MGSQSARSAAEAAATLHGNDLDAVLRQLEHVATSERVLNEPWVLAQSVELTGGVPLRQHGVGLQVTLWTIRNAIRLLDDDVGLRQALRHVAALQPACLQMFDRLGGLASLFTRTLPCAWPRWCRLGPGLGHGRRAGFHGLERIDGGGRTSYSTSMRSRASSAMAGSSAATAATGCPRTPRVDGEDGVGPRGRLLLEVRHVGGGQHRADTGQRLGAARVDALMRRARATA